MFICQNCRMLCVAQVVPKGLKHTSGRDTWLSVPAVSVKGAAGSIYIYKQNGSTIVVSDIRGKRSKPGDFALRSPGCPAQQYLQRSCTTRHRGRIDLCEQQGGG
jgi:hypothetical protein